MRNREYFTAVVADDESELREAVCRMIPWEELGFRLVGSAGNGLDALQLVEQLQPDFLMTDIRMPFISGVSLARQVRELQPLIQIAFLSGYDDFEYAQKGIDYDVISYLLKPISMSELAAALSDIHRKMEAKFNYYRALGEAGSDLRELLLTLLLDDACESEDEAALSSALAEAGLALPDSASMTVLSLALFRNRENRADREAAALAERVLGRKYRCHSFYAGGRALCLLASEAGFAELGQALDELTSVARRMLGLDCVVGVSREFSLFGGCRRACREAEEARRAAADPGIYPAGEPDSAAHGGGMRQLCDMANGIIEREYMDEALSLSSVSQRLHVSPNYLSANMKKYAGDTFINLLIKKRMEVASSLLRAGGLKIFEVARRCGYSDQHYFSFCFKKYYGLSPAQLRRGGEGKEAAKP